jgi:hypothetical protein
VTNSENFLAYIWKSTPRPVKILVLVQTLIILSLSFWIYEEYLNNQYLQRYVNGSFESSLSAIILVSIGAFAIVALVLFAKLRGARRELGGIRSRKLGSEGREAGQLDPQVEQHLIEMIRRTQPIFDPGTTTGGLMPVLRRRDSPSSLEEQESS